jgi:hypothetical protein
VTSTDQRLADLEFQVRGLQNSLKTLEGALVELIRRVDIAQTPRDVRYVPTGIPGVGVIRDRHRVGI